MNSTKTAPNVEPARHWINGEWIGSSTVANSVSFSTGKVLGQYSAGVTVNSPVVKDEIPKRFGGSRQWLGIRCCYWRTQITQNSNTNKEPEHEQ